MLKPINKGILCRFIEPEAKHGIIIMAKPQVSRTTALVVAIAEDVSQVSVGDCIEIQYSYGQEFEDGVIIKEEHVLGIHRVETADLSFAEEEVE